MDLLLAACSGTTRSRCTFVTDPPLPRGAAGADGAPQPQGEAGEGASGRAGEVGPGRSASDFTFTVAFFFILLEPSQRSLQ